MSMPKTFRIRLSGSGTDLMNADYDRIESESASALAMQVINCITDDFAGKRKAQLQFDLACYLLSGLQGYTEKELQKNISNPKEILDRWTLKKPKKKVKEDLK